MKELIPSQIFAFPKASPSSQTGPLVQPQEPLQKPSPVRRLSSTRKFRVLLNESNPFVDNNALDDRRSVSLNNIDQCLMPKAYDCSTTRASTLNSIDQSLMPTVSDCASAKASSLNDIDLSLMSKATACSTGRVSWRGYAPSPNRGSLRQLSLESRRSSDQERQTDPMDSTNSRLSLLLSDRRKDVISCDSGALSIDGSGLCVSLDREAAASTAPPPPSKARRKVEHLDALDALEIEPAQPSLHTLGQNDLGCIGVHPLALPPLGNLTQPHMQQASPRTMVGLHRPRFDPCALASQNLQTPTLPTPRLGALGYSTGQRIMQTSEQKIVAHARHTRGLLS